jgi:hypothetical protein
MNIDLDWINRFGIVLNFLAGFMIAPELIGEKTISNYENKIEKKLNNLIDYINPKLSYSTEYSNKIIGMASEISETISKILDFLPFDSGNIVDKILSFIFKIFIIIVAIFIKFIGTLIVKILESLKILTDKIADFFKPDDTLKNFLVFWGVIFLIVGNLFQLIATFK